MSKAIDDALVRAIIGQKSVEPPQLDRAAVRAELVAELLPFILAQIPREPAGPPEVTVVPAPRTAWRFRFVRREGLLEEIVAIPIDPRDAHG